jgi:hypothetical protein
LDKGASLPYSLNLSSDINNELALQFAENGGFATFTMLRMFKGIFKSYVEISIVHTMKNHIHSAEVVGGSVKFLTVELEDITFLPQS